MVDQRPRQRDPLLLAAGELGRLLPRLGLELDGLDVGGLPPYARDVNTVFQDYALFPHMSVLDNVGYGLRIRKVDKA